MVPPLLLVLLTFLTIISLSNFCSLNPCFTTILLFMNIPVAPLFKSALTVTLLCVSTFSMPMFNYTSFSILKVCLTSLCLLPSFAALFRSTAYVLPCCTFSSIGCVAFIFFWHPHYFCLFEITPCSLFSSIWYPFCPYLLHSTYNTITSSVYYSSSNRHVSSGMPFL